ncbi:MAG TPA: 5-deoxy-glucuronate isomerase, partial [Burkholderiaceae bacterium]|nr:5-deoxy-glucuronate isomerase [Burkholderiaceae bacterium]
MMPSRLLAKARSEGREIVDVTPERAGWGYVGFRALRLVEGETEAFDSGTREWCIVVLTGTVDVRVDGRAIEGLGTRSSVFDPVAPAA